MLARKNEYFRGSRVLLKRILLVLLLLSVAGGALAEGFTLTDTKGKVHTLAGYKGKWVLVNFWATWCPPCLEEIPDLNELHDSRKDRDLVVIGIAMDYRSEKQVKDFADSMFISYPIVLGDAKTVAQIGQVPGLPTTYLYNPQGKLKAYNVGALTKKAVESYIASKK